MQIVIIFIALLLSLFCHYDVNVEIAWWELYIPPITILAIILSSLTISNRNNYFACRKFPIMMSLIIFIGLIPIFLPGIANTSIRAMYITLAIPWLIYFYDNDRNSKIVKSLIYIIFIISFATVIFISSRTGIITMLLSGIYILILKFKLKKKYIVATFGILILFLFLFLLLFIKKDSSSGRIFILKNTTEMIIEKPFGRGSTGFETDYMIKQAEYFRNNNDEEAAMFADDIKHPLNEYMYVAVNYGIPTLVVILVAVALLISRLYKENSKESRCFIHFITLLLVWSFFSYPFSVAYVIVVLLAYIVTLPQTSNLLSKKNISPH